MTKERDHQKEARQQKIVELVEAQAIKTQGELLAHLNAAGFAVTQATISRDIRELQIGKSASGPGAYHYVITKKADHLKRFEMIFLETARQIDYAGNIVLVKCLTGMANAACELFDHESMDWGDVVGTLSGDNTFLILMRTEADAAALCKQLQRYIENN